MNIVMMTNTYLPHVGGVARSVDRFAREYRKRGHRVLVVAPTFEGAQKSEPGVVRVPAIQNFNGSDFSVALPVPLLLKNALDEFEPDVIHSHHPFLLGDVALRQAAARSLPLIFTHHTMYEHYTHYVPGDADTLRVLAREMCAVYANHCDRVIAPSTSVREVLAQHGVRVPVAVVPTGVAIEEFEGGDGTAFRRDRRIPDDAFLVGHVGRLAPEKNLRFLTEAVARCLKKHKQAHFLVVGSGPEQDFIHEYCAKVGVAPRTHITGALTGQTLVDAYHAMDVFVFASKSETQGMVLVEAMAAGTPVVAIAASGVNDVLLDQKNGVLLKEEDWDAFAEALDWIQSRAKTEREALIREARRTATSFSSETCAEKALEVYDEAIRSVRREQEEGFPQWTGLLDAIGEQWRLWSDRISAASDVMRENSGD